MAVKVSPLIHEGQNARARAKKMGRALGLQKGLWLGDRSKVNTDYSVVYVVSAPNLEGYTGFGNLT